MPNIQNAGTEIIGTDYYGSRMAEAGKFYLSVTAGTFRWLIPDSMTAIVRAQLRAGRECVISIGPWPNVKLKRGIEIVIAAPGKIQDVYLLPDNCLDRQLTAEDTRHQFTLAAWARGPVKLGELPARLRFVERVPTHTVPGAAS